jgi:uroporphyrinogen III methyltransferase/synthase
LSTQNRSGIVFLVGAGPGDPGLISVRGAKLLEHADVVVYDYLANKRLLNYCPHEAELIYVGKKAASHTMSQEQINALLVELGRKGKRVVRLKGGDPYVFGRGGEEGEALRAAGVAFGVVPGITAAIAAPCYAGIPVTHRDFNSSFTLITGHEKDDDDVSDIEWPVIAKLPCVAFYMGARALPSICRTLIEHGMDPTTPAATIQWGTRPQQRTVVATVADLPRRVAEAGVGAPAITIIGRVVSMRDTLNWFERRPLFGRTIVVTRTRQQASELSNKLEELGAQVIEAPTIELVPPPSWEEVDRALREVFDWVIFTSANAVTHAKRRLLEIGLDARAFGGAKVAAIGDATARAVVEELCLKVDLCPDSFVAEALADALAAKNEIGGKRHLLLHADIARAVLRERLQQAGSALVCDVAIYGTKRAAVLPPELLEALAEKRVGWITFTSSSTARNFAELLGKDYRAALQDVSLASIGPITTTALRELGLNATIEANPSNIEGLVNAMMSAEANRPTSA